MRTIERTGQFKRDYRRELRGQHRATIEQDLASVVAALAGDTPLAARYRDHGLTGESRDFRDCHIRPDPVLIYRRVGTDRLQVVRLGSHSELL